MKVEGSPGLRYLNRDIVMGSFSKTATQGRLADSVKKGTPYLQIVGKRESVKSEKDHAQEIADRQPRDKSGRRSLFSEDLESVGFLGASRLFKRFGL